LAIEVIEGVELEDGLEVKPKKLSIPNPLLEKPVCTSLDMNSRK